MTPRRVPNILHILNGLSEKEIDVLYEAADKARQPLDDWYEKTKEWIKKGKPIDDLVQDEKDKLFYSVNFYDTNMELITARKVKHLDICKKMTTFFFPFNTIEYYVEEVACSLVTSGDLMVYYKNGTAIGIKF
jgi:hypothetical protein